MPLYLLHNYMFEALPDNTVADCIQLAVLLPLALALFLTATRLLGVQEIGFAIRSFVVPTWKRFSIRRAKILN